MEILNIQKNIQTITRLWNKEISSRERKIDIYCYINPATWEKVDRNDTESYLLSNDPTRNEPYDRTRAHNTRWTFKNRSNEFPDNI